MRWVNRTSGIKRYQLQLAARQRQPGNKWTSVWTRLQRIHISRSIPQGQRREKVKVSGKSEKSRVGEIKKYFHFPAADYLYSPWLHFTPLIFVSIAAVPPLQHRCCYSNSFGNYCHVTHIVSERRRNFDSYCVDFCHSEKINCTLNEVENGAPLCQHVLSIAERNFWFYLRRQIFTSLLWI